MPAGPSAPSEVPEPAPRGECARRHAEPADVPRRQREPPAGVVRDVEVAVHRGGRGEQRVFRKRDPFRRAGAAGSFEQHVAAQFRKIRDVTGETARRDGRGIAPEPAAR